jgi:hypothetical protein
MKIFTNKELKLLPITNKIKEIYSKILEEASLGKTFYKCSLDKINQEEIIKGVRFYFPEMEINNEDEEVKFKWFNDDIKIQDLNKIVIDLNNVYDKINGVNYII